MRLSFQEKEEEEEEEEEIAKVQGFCRKDITRWL